MKRREERGAERKLVAGIFRETVRHLDGRTLPYGKQWFLTHASRWDGPVTFVHGKHRGGGGVAVAPSSLAESLPIARLAIPRRFNLGDAGIGFRICEAATNVLIRNAAERDPGSKTERRDLPGFTGDQLHAMAGAGYCDLFTCDWETLKWVGPIRKTLVSLSHCR